MALSPPPQKNYNSLNFFLQVLQKNSSSADESKLAPSESMSLFIELIPGKVPVYMKLH